MTTRGKNRHDQGSDEEVVQPDGFQSTENEPRPLVTTSQAARIAGVSASTIVRNRTELGAVPGPNGAYLFSEDVVRQRITTIRRRQAVTALGPASGEVASAVFAAFKAAKHPSDIVIDLRVTPEVVLALRDKYDEMHGLKRLPAKQRSMCPCGADRLAAFCNKCKGLVLDFPELERRVSPEGQEEVRATARVIWGRLREKRPGQQSELVMLTLVSEWRRVDSDEGADLCKARPPYEDG